MTMFFLLMLDTNMAKIVPRELETNGVKVITGERVEEVVGSGSRDDKSRL